MRTEVELRRDLEALRHLRSRLSTTGPLAAIRLEGWIEGICVALEVVPGSQAADIELTGVVEGIRHAMGLNPRLDGTPTVLEELAAEAGAFFRREEVFGVRPVIVEGQPSDKEMNSVGTL